jgi:MFS transporter, NNP family, nitrate/nitrite transporter
MATVNPPVLPEKEDHKDRKDINKLTVFNPGDSSLIAGKDPQVFSDQSDKNTDSVSGTDKEWLHGWKPEDSTFWETKGKKIAWTTLSITTVSLVLSFASWFLMSVVVIKLPQIGFTFSKMQLFWLASMPGLAGGSFRILQTFMVPLYGTRKVITISTLIKIIPLTGLAYALTHQETSFAFFMVIAFFLGFGGGDFSSFMPSTSIFFPKKLQGTALGIQAGIGNFGVSLVQLVSPWILGFAVFGALGGSSQTIVESGKEIWLQNVALLYILPLFLVGLVAWFNLKSIPMKTSFREQFDIFGSKHTWFCTLTYFMTFGTFAGLSAAFPLLIKTLYGGFENAPDPLAYAFYGPLIGSAVRVLAGPVADKVGGAVLTHITGIAIIISICCMITMGLFTPESMEQFPYFVFFVLVIFFFTGVGNAATFRQFPVIFSDSPRRAAGVIGWTAAIAAYGPFIYNLLIGLITESTGSPKVFFMGVVVLCIAATLINYQYYLRRGCEKPS